MVKEHYIHTQVNEVQSLKIRYSHKETSICAHGILLAKANFVHYLSADIFSVTDNFFFATDNLKCPYSNCLELI